MHRYTNSLPSPAEHWPPTPSLPVRSYPSSSGRLNYIHCLSADCWLWLLEDGSLSSTPEASEAGYFESFHILSWLDFLGSTFDLIDPADRTVPSLLSFVQFYKLHNFIFRTFSFLKKWQNWKRTEQQSIKIHDPIRTNNEIKLEWIHSRRKNNCEQLKTGIHPQIICVGNRGDERTEQSRLLCFSLLLAASSCVVVVVT